MVAEYVVRHYGEKGCGHPAFWVGRLIDETLLVYGVFALDGGRPEAGHPVFCGVCGERVIITAQLPLWIERAAIIADEGLATT